MYQHSIEDLTIGLLLSQLLPRLPQQQLLESPLFEVFLVRYPHFRSHPQDVNSLLLRSPDIFATCSPLINYVSGSYPSTPVKKLHHQQLELFGSSSGAGCSTFDSGKALDLSPSNRTPNNDELMPRPFRSRLFSDASLATLSQQSTDTDIDVTSLSQPVASVEDESPAEPLDSTERKFKCPDCPSTYKLKAHLKRHQKSAHSSDRPYTCQLCPKSFKLKELLNQHVLTHGMKNPFKCEACRCRFGTASELSKHKSTHHNDCVYKCFHCKLKFSSLCFMYTHLHLKHHCVLQCAKCGDPSKEDLMLSEGGGGPKKTKTVPKIKADCPPASDNFKCLDRKSKKLESKGSPIVSGLRSILGDGF
jgi:uncharacterized Zn-finger protein